MMVSILLILVLASATVLDAQGIEVPQFDPKDVSQIQFRYSYEDTTQVIITDPSQVLTIMATLELHPKGPCECDHTMEVVFTVAGTKVGASVCGHCFDLSGKYRGRWTMPEKFFAFMEAYRDSVDLLQPWDRKSGLAH